MEIALSYTIHMQNRYTGDIGDFGKYGMLRGLCTGEKLGIIWYLVPDEQHNDDGNKTSYLDHDKEHPTKLNVKRYRNLDPELYDKLRKIVKDENRNVAAIRVNDILSTSTNVFFEEHVPRFDRKEWLQGAHDLVQSCDILFLDPDNGLQVKRMKKPSKHVFWDNLSVYSSSQSLIIYQHRQRKSLNAQIEEQTRELREKIGNRKIYTLTFSPNPDKKPEPKPDRIYYIISSINDSRLPEKELQRFCNEWKGLFTYHFAADPTLCSPSIRAAVSH